MTLKKCYIAGKISNLPIEEYTKNFTEAASEVIELHMQPVSPIELIHNHDLTWLSYMKEDLQMMLSCDCVFAQRNWKHSNGATIEVELAQKLGMNIVYQALK